MSDSPTLFADEQDLMDELRAMAPRPTAEFTTQLDARAAERFGEPEPERAAAAPSKKRRRFSLPLLTGSLASAAVAAVVVVVIVSSGGGTSGDTFSASTSSSGEASVAAAPQRSADESAGAGAAADATAVAPQSAAPPSPAGSAPRRVERQAQLTISIAHGKFDEAAARVPQIAAGANAIIDTSRVSMDSGGGEATYTLRIPVDRLGDTMAQLSRLGRVTSSDATGNDITGTYVSAADRLGDLRAERDSVRRQLAGEADPDKAQELSRRLNSLRTEVAQARGEVVRLQQRTSYATVNLTLEERSADGASGSDDDRGGIAGALDDAGHILGGMAAVGIVVLAVAVPIALLVALLWKGAGVLRRRRREAGLA